MPADDKANDLVYKQEQRTVISCRCSVKDYVMSVQKMKKVFELKKKQSQNPSKEHQQ